MHVCMVKAENLEVLTMHNLKALRPRSMLQSCLSKDSGWQIALVVCTANKLLKLPFSIEQEGMQRRPGLTHKRSASIQ
jgi:hypothetical protein